MRIGKNRGGAETALPFSVLAPRLDHRTVGCNITESLSGSNLGRFRKFLKAGELVDLEHNQGQKYVPDQISQFLDYDGHYYVKCRG